MFRTLLTASAALILAIPVSAADKVDQKKLKGKWERDVCGSILTFEFKDEKTMTAYLKPAGADKPAVIKCAIKIDGDGKLSGKITEIEKNGIDGAPDAGEEFSFKIEVGEKTLIISDFKGPGDGGNAKDLIQGEYKKKAD